jgi:hypothetical protein
MGLVRSLGICLNINGTIDEISMKENKQLSTTGAWGMDFVSSSPFSLLYCISRKTLDTEYTYYS